MLFNIVRTNTAVSTTADLISITAGAVRSFLIEEYDFTGDGTASAANELGIYRVATAGVTGSGLVVPLQVESSVTATAFSGVVTTVWATQPTLAAAPVQVAGVNANGGSKFWRCNPNKNNAIVVPGGANAAASISIRAVLGTSNISARVQINEF